MIFQPLKSADIQIVFASLDNSVEEMHNYMRGKPWPAIRRNPNGGPSAVDFLGDKFRVSMIPTVTLLSVVYLFPACDIGSSRQSHHGLGALCCKVTNSPY